LRRTFRRILGSDVGSSLEKALQLYRTVAIPAIFYGEQVWFSRSGPTKLRSKYLAYLRTTQNDFLRIIARAFSSVKVAFLQLELNTIDIDIEMERRRLQSLAKLIRKPVWNTIADARALVYKCRKNNLFLTRDMRHRKPVDPFLSRLAEAQDFWRAAQQNHGASLNSVDDIALALKAYGHSRANSQMVERWDSARAHYLSRRIVPVSALEKWGPHVLDVHKNLSIQESRVLIQLRSGTVRLRAYLHRIGVSQRLLLLDIF
jgi:hypothetical protein